MTSSRNSGGMFPRATFNDNLSPTMSPQVDVQGNNSGKRLLWTDNLLGITVGHTSNGKFHRRVASSNASSTTGDVLHSYWSFGSTHQKLHNLSCSWISEFLIFPRISELVPQQRIDSPANIELTDAKFHKRFSSLLGVEQMKLLHRNYMSCSVDSTHRSRGFHLSPYRFGNRTSSTELPIHHELPSARRFDSE